MLLNLKLVESHLAIDFVSNSRTDLRLLCRLNNLFFPNSDSFMANENRKEIREVLQTEFRFRFWKGPRQISAGPG